MTVDDHKALGGGAAGSGNGAGGGGGGGCVRLSRQGFVARAHGNAHQLRLAINGSLTTARGACSLTASLFNGDDNIGVIGVGGAAALPLRIGAAVSILLSSAIVASFGGSGSGGAVNGGGEGGNDGDSLDLDIESGAWSLVSGRSYHLQLDASSWVAAPGSGAERCDADLLWGSVRGGVPGFDLATEVGPDGEDCEKCDASNHNFSCERDW